MMGNTRTASGGSRELDSQSARSTESCNWGSACFLDRPPGPADFLHKRSGVRLSFQSPPRVLESPRWCSLDQSFCSLCERPLHAKEYPATRPPGTRPVESVRRRRSEEHTSELQSQFHLVCR